MEENSALMMPYAGLVCPRIPHISNQKNSLRPASGESGICTRSDSPGQLLNGQY
jgi:hypothetical protein